MGVIIAGTYVDVQRNSLPTNGVPPESCAVVKHFFPVLQLDSGTVGCCVKRYMHRQYLSAGSSVHLLSACSQQHVASIPYSCCLSTLLVAQVLRGPW